MADTFVPDIAPTAAPTKRESFPEEYVRTGPDTIGG
jgi:hypothetical protein